jgi:hypothetical protein
MRAKDENIKSLAKTQRRKDKKNFQFFLCGLGGFA